MASHGAVFAFKFRLFTPCPLNLFGGRIFPPPGCQRVGIIYNMFIINYLFNILRSKCPKTQWANWPVLTSWWPPQSPDSIHGYDNYINRNSTRAQAQSDVVSMSRG